VSIGAQPFQPRGFATKIATKADVSAAITVATKACLLLKD
jgi:hypothetical protein